MAGSWFEAVRTGSDVVIACRISQLDLSSAPQLLAAVEAVDLRGVRTLRIDLSGVEYADTALVAVLVLLLRSFPPPERTLTVSPASPAVEAILALHRLSELPRPPPLRRVS